MNGCLCGCGKLVQYSYARGHNFRQLSSEVIKARSDKLRGKPRSTAVKDACARALTGRVRPREIVDRIAKSKTGKPLSENHRAKIGASHLGMKRSAITIANISRSLKGKPKSLEHRKKMLKRRIPSYPETRIQELILRYRLPYRYVGNGEVWIGNANPDFIHLCEKSVLEVYGTRHKIDVCKIEDYETTRKLHYAQYGFKVVFFNEKDYFGADWEKRCLSKMDICV